MAKWLDSMGNLGFHSEEQAKKLGIKPGPYTKMNSENLKRIVAHYEPILQGMEEDLQWELKEGIEKKNSSNHKNRLATIDYIKNIVDVANIMAKNIGRETKPSTKPNKPAYIPVEKIIKQAASTYKKHDDNLHVTSLSPDKVVGKNIVITFDVSQRLMKVIVAEAGKTLSFNRTALMNVDVSKSYEKKISNTDFIKETLSLSKMDILRKLSAIKNTQYILKTLYINSNTLFLRVF